MADDDLNIEPFGPSVEITIKISAEMMTQELGDNFRAYAIITAECGNQKPVRRMMLPGPYDGPKDDKQLEEFKARWRAQLEWVALNIAGPGVAFADSLVIKAYQVDEGVKTEATGRKLIYTRRQAERFRELLPERERFWNEARKNGLVDRDSIWEVLAKAFEATEPRKWPPETKGTKSKYKPWQIALVHAALDAGVRLGEDGILSIGQWRTIKRELVDREG